MMRSTKGATPESCNSSLEQVIPHNVKVRQLRESARGDGALHVTEGGRGIIVLRACVDGVSLPVSDGTYLQCLHLRL